MLKKWWEAYWKKNEIAAVEVKINGAGQYVFHAALLEQKEEQLRVLGSSGSLNLSELQEFLSDDSEVLICISGKGVLNKVLSKSTSDFSIQKVLPKARQEDFYFQYSSCARHDLASVCRKEVVEKVQHILIDAGFRIVHIELGIYGLQGLLPLLALENGSHRLGRFQLEVQDADILAIDEVEVSEESRMSIEGEELNARSVLAFANGFQYLLGGQSYEFSNLVMNEHLAEEMVQRKQFKVISWGALLLVFGLLLVNFLSFSAFNNRNADLAAEYEGKREAMRQYVELKDAQEAKSDFIQVMGWSRKPMTDFYADQIGQTVPEGILLDNLSINTPVKKKNNRDKEQLFDYEMIELTGMTKRLSELNNWINELKQLDWVKEVDYSYENMDNSSVGQFILRITK